MILAMASRGENLDRLLKEQQRTASWLAKELGLPSRQSVYNWIEGKYPRDPSVWNRIAEKLGVPVAEIDDTLAPSTSPNIELVESDDSEHLNLVPYWGAVPCGDWEAPTGDPEMIRISNSIKDTTGVIAVRVRGNSLKPRLLDRQLVAIKLSKEKIDGVITLFLNGEGELSLKVNTQTPQGWELHSINPDYPPIKASEVTILGHAISFEEYDPLGLRA